MADRKIDAILFYSERGAGTFTDIVKREALAGALADIRLLALSSQVARPLGGLSPSRTEVAAEPTEASFFALLASSD
jgi:uroporphyrinogen-III synthase